MLRSGRKFQKLEDEVNTMTVSSRYNVSTDCHPALLNNVVLRHVFTVINFRDLKSCRNVCHEWRSVCEPIFRKRAKVSFHDEATSEDMKILKHLFSNVKVPIVTLELSESIDWKVTQLQSFFRKEGRIITELKMQDFNLLNRRGNPCQKIDTSSFITPNLKKIFYYSFEYLHDKVNVVSFSTASMLSLDSILLTGATIILNNDCRISPTNLHLRCNKYFRNGKKCTELSVHEFVNFERLENLELHPTELAMSLDLQGSASFDTLCFCGNLILKNWETSQWCTKDLSLYSIPFVKMTNMTVLAELEIHRSRVDLYVLPRTIKKLNLRSCEEIICSSPVNLRQLQCLSSDKNRNLDFLSHFSTCTNLKDLIIINQHYQEPKINVDHIPRSVKRIFMDYQNEFVGNTTLDLETIVVSNIRTNSDYMNDLLTSPLNPKNLILHHSCILSPLAQLDYPYHTERIVNFREEQYETVIFGRFEWDTERKFIESNLPNYVDEKAGYYIFKDGRGTAITLKKIHEIVFGKERAFKDCESTYWSALGSQWIFA